MNNYLDPLSLAVDSVVNIPFGYTSPEPTTCPPDDSSEEDVVAAGYPSKPNYGAEDPLGGWHWRDCRWKAQLSCPDYTYCYFPEGLGAVTNPDPDLGPWVISVIHEEDRCKLITTDNVIVWDEYLDPAFLAENPWFLEQQTLHGNLINAVNDFNAAAGGDAYLYDQGLGGPPPGVTAPRPDYSKAGAVSTTWSADECGLLGVPFPGPRTYCYFPSITIFPVEYEEISVEFELGTGVGYIRLKLPDGTTVIEIEKQEMPYADALDYYADPATFDAEIQPLIDTYNETNVDKRIVAGACNCDPNQQGARNPGDDASYYSQLALTMPGGAGDGSCNRGTTSSDDWVWGWYSFCECCKWLSEPLCPCNKVCLFDGPDSINPPVDVSVYDNDGVCTLTVDSVDIWSKEKPGKVPVDEYDAWVASAAQELDQAISDWNAANAPRELRSGDGCKCKCEISLDTDDLPREDTPAGDLPILNEPPAFDEPTSVGYLVKLKRTGDKWCGLEVGIHDVRNVANSFTSGGFIQSKWNLSYNSGFPAAPQVDDCYAFSDGKRFNIDWTWDEKIKRKFDRDGQGPRRGEVSNVPDDYDDIIYAKATFEPGDESAIADETLVVHNESLEMNPDCWCIARKYVGGKRGGEMNPLNYTYFWKYLCSYIPPADNKYESLFIKYYRGETDKSWSPTNTPREDMDVTLNSNDNKWAIKDAGGPRLFNNGETATWDQIIDDRSTRNSLKQKDSNGFSKVPVTAIAEGAGNQPGYDPNSGWSPPPGEAGKGNDFLRRQRGAWALPMDFGGPGVVGGLASPIPLLNNETVRRDSETAGKSKADYYKQ